MLNSTVTAPPAGPTAPNIAGFAVSNDVIICDKSPIVPSPRPFPRASAFSGACGSLAKFGFASVSGARVTSSSVSPSSTRALSIDASSASTRPRHSNRCAFAGTPETPSTIRFTAGISACDRRRRRSVSPRKRLAARRFRASASPPRSSPRRRALASVILRCPLASLRVVAFASSRAPSSARARSVRRSDARVSSRARCRARSARGRRWTPSP